LEEFKEFKEFEEFKEEKGARIREPGARRPAVTATANRIGFMDLRVNDY
jgi:hypothetical protein